MSTRADQLEKVRTAKGFIAALDQSGGSTPKALKLYGIGEDAYSNDAEMYAIIHEMRTRIITSPAFNGDRILGAILFENTLDREIEGKNSARFLWDEKRVVPFLKVDKGLETEADGVQLMKPIPNLAKLLDKAKAQNVFGTKMRSVIKSANAGGIERIVAQQFEIGKEIVAAGLTPIIEPEIDIKAQDKRKCEDLLRKSLLAHLDKLGSKELVMFKLTLPDESNFYRPCQQHRNMLRVVALSGGYSRAEANRRLAQNNGMIASFSRALTEGLTAQQSDAEFNAMLDEAIQSIFDASCT
ncbi:MAG TPA: fructose bisphosphate aldolase [Gammaproteobacteria bacterium]|nr:fructose bisphosphate aldolase [Gammaproteobacteria bacterium]